MAEPENLQAARRYLAAIERGAIADELASFFSPDVVQREFPNRLLPAGTTRHLKQILDGAEAGQKLLEAQRFEILHSVTEGENVALEVQWTGRLAAPVPGLPASGTMRARFGVFLRYRDGKITSQHNYDCFEPW